METMITKTKKLHLNYKKLPDEVKTFLDVVDIIEAVNKPDFGKRSVFTKINKDIAITRRSLDRLVLRPASIENEATINALLENYNRLLLSKDFFNKYFK